MENGHIADIHITSNSSMQGFEAQKARLNHQFSWCAISSPSYLQVDLNANYLVCAIATQGSGNSSVSAFVMEFEVEFSINGTEWDFYSDLAGTQVKFTK